MLAIIFISMLVPMLVMGLPMVGSYAMAFLVPFYLVRRCFAFLIW